MKLESDKHVVCEGSCKECVRCLRLYLCDAEDCGGECVEDMVWQSPSFIEQFVVGVVTARRTSAGLPGSTRGGARDPALMICAKIFR